MMTKFLKALVICFLWIIPNAPFHARDTVLVDLIHLPFPIKSIASDSQGTIYLATSNGLKVFRSGQLETIDPDEKDYIISRNGEVLTLRENILRDKKGYGFPWGRFSEWKKFIPGNSWYISSAEDNSGRVWVANGSNIYIFKIENRFDSFFEGHSMRGLLKYGDDLYVNSYNGIFRNGQRLFDRPRFAEGYIENIKDELYVAWGHLFVYDPVSGERNEIHLSSQLKKKHKLQMIAVVTREISDTIWVGSNYGLSFIKGDSLYSFLDSVDVRDFREIEGRFLLATFRHGVFEKIGNSIVKLDLPVNLNYDQILYRDNQYFFPTNKGLLIWDGYSTYILTTEDGLSNDFTVSAQFDKDGFLWVASLAGINRINLESRVITNYLNDVEFNLRSYLATSDSLFFGSTNGIYKFAPRDFIGDDLVNLSSAGRSYYVHLLWIVAILASIFLIVLNKRIKRRREERLEEEKKNAERKIMLLQLEQYVFQSTGPINVRDLSNYLELSERSLYRFFQEYGMTPGKFIKDQRIKKIRYLIEQKGINDLKELSKTIGYSELYLGNLIKRLYITVPEADK